MTITQHHLICVLCGATFPGRPAAGDYGLCPDHWNKDALREWDRLESTRRRLAPGTPQSLTLAEWMQITGQWRGLCAICEQVPFSAIAVWDDRAGLVAGNVVPLCRVCTYHREHGWERAINRVHLQLQREVG